MTRKSFIQSLFLAPVAAAIGKNLPVEKAIVGAVIEGPPVEFMLSADGSWAVFDGASGAVFGSHGIKSVNRTAAGSYTIEFPPKKERG